VFAENSYFGHFQPGYESNLMAAIYPKRHLQLDSMPFFPLASRFLTLLLRHARNQNCKSFPRLLGFFFLPFLFPFPYLLAAVIDLLLGLLPVQKLQRKHHHDGQFMTFVCSLLTTTHNVYMQFI